MEYIVCIKDKEERNELSFEFEEIRNVTAFVTKIMNCSDYPIEIITIKKEN